MRCRHLMEKMRNLCLQSQCSKKEDTISFLSRNLLCNNTYTMSAFIWSNELFCILKWCIPYLYCIFLFSFLTYEVSYSKKCGIYFCDWLSNCILWNLFLRWTYPKLHFEDQIFSVSGQNHKNKIRNNLFRNNLWSQKFLPWR